MLVTNLFHVLPENSLLIAFATILFTIGWYDWISSIKLDDINVEHSFASKVFVRRTPLSIIVAPRTAFWCNKKAKAKTKNVSVILWVFTPRAVNIVWSHQRIEYHCEQLGSMFWLIIFEFCLFIRLTVFCVLFLASTHLIISSYRLVKVHERIRRTEMREKNKR